MAKSVTDNYKQTMKECIKLYCPTVTDEELDPIVDYSINKRYKEEKCQVVNSYTNKTANMTLLRVADYINSRKPIVTAHGTMFERHANVPNPMGIVIQQFMDQRDKDKKMMFKFPKGSEEFEKYNLAQILDKIDVNGIYGVLGMYTSLLFNINVASSITAQGRALISSATMLMESFLSNSVKFGSLNETIEFINKICREERKYSDTILLDKPITLENCFTKIIDSCGYRWLPDDNEMEVIWRTLSNLGQEDINRLYYKNNLYEFLSNKPIKDYIIHIMQTLEKPYFNPLKCPNEIKLDLEEFTNILKEYVYYDNMYIDRIDRCDSMMKSVVMISDTDSCIVSLDAWYRFVLELVRDVPLQIKKTDPVSVIKFYKKDEFGDYIDKDALKPIYFEDADLDYDFYNDEVIEKKHMANPFTILPQDWLRYSIINIMSFVLDKLINDYMVKFTKNNNSWDEARSCKILMKNEFLFKRVLMTMVMKSYASLQEVQEGNIVPKNKQMDIKGIAAMAKSSMADSTRKALQKVLMEDILRADTIDQLRIIKDLAIIEKRIIKSIQSGSKEFYKPVTVKSINTYENPMRIQGIKASIVWNTLKSSDLPGINIEERNAIYVAKCDINKYTIEDLKDYPEVYENAKKLMNEEAFGGKIDAVAVPLDTKVPDWLMEVIDYKTIVNDNISGFPIESIGIPRLGNDNVNYTNILQL